MSSKNILLLGRKGIIAQDAISHINNPRFTIYGGTCIEDVRTVFAQTQNKIDHVFMGAGIDLDNRLDIVREVFESSGETAVHLKDAKSGPAGFLPFVKGVLEGVYSN